MDIQKAHKFRSVAATCLYMSFDRLDMQLAAKYLFRHIP